MAQSSDLPSLAGAAWLADARLQSLLCVLNRHGETRVAGGAVRNALLGVDVADVDLATTLLPHDVMRICGEQGFGIHPTGLDHGTITITVDRHPFEVTTMRKDVQTDGRRAVVSFTTDWSEDAARRDFTMNALYCDNSGKIYDFTNGYVDILKHKVRFVGAAQTRIREDYLRILRFFRFHAQYGKGAPDRVGLAACEKLKAGLSQLSAERIRQELLKLLQAPRAVPTLKIMAARGVLRKIIPHTDEWRVINRLPADGVLRLYALAKKPTELKESLRLSNEQARRIADLQEAPVLSPRLSLQERRRIAYQVGKSAWADAAKLSHARSRAAVDDLPWLELVQFADTYDLPSFPLTGRDLAAAGIAPGPAMGLLLSKLEDWWLASDFKPGKEELLQQLSKSRP